MYFRIPDTALVIGVQEAQDLVSFQTAIGKDKIYLHAELCS